MQNLEILKEMPNKTGLTEYSPIAATFTDLEIACLFLDAIPIAMIEGQDRKHGKSRV